MIHRHLLLTAALVLALTAGTANACTPPLPPPGPIGDETPEAFRARMATEAERTAKAVADYELSVQTSAWDRAATVIVARQVATSTGWMVEHGMPTQTARLDRTFQPVTWLKGKGARRDLGITWTAYGGCGGFADDAGSNGKLFALYFLPGKPASKTLVLSAAIDTIREPRAKVALTSAQQ